MSNVKINPILPLLHANSSRSGYSNGGSYKDGNKDKYSGQTFQDIFKQKLESQSLKIK